MKWYYKVLLILLILIVLDLFLEGGRQLEFISVLFKINRLIIFIILVYSIVRLFKKSSKNRISVNGENDENEELVQVLDKEIEVTESINVPNLIIILNKENRTEILGKRHLFDDEISLVAKLNYTKGIEYFDRLYPTDKLDKKPIIHLVKRKIGIEISIANLFKKNLSVGISYKHINHILLKGAINTNHLNIILKNHQIISFTFETYNHTEIKSFFQKKLKLVVEDKIHLQ